MNVNILDGKYTIKSDRLQYILFLNKEGVDEETGETKVVTTTDGYFHDINHLFEYLIEVEQRVNNCRTLEGYMKHCKEVNKRIEAELKILCETAEGKSAFRKMMEKLEE